MPHLGVLYDMSQSIHDLLVFGRQALLSELSTRVSLSKKFALTSHVRFRRSMVLLFMPARMANKVEKLLKSRHRCGICVSDADTTYT